MTTESLLAQVPVQDILTWRHYLHAHPELSFQEYKTTDYIISILETFPNLELQRPTETGVVAILKGGKPGKTIALRADIDAFQFKKKQTLILSRKMMVSCMLVVMIHIHQCF